MTLDASTGSKNRNSTPEPQTVVVLVTNTSNSLLKASRVPDNSVAYGSGKFENVELQNLILTPAAINQREK